jgi:hemerythrin superfamily protein
MTRRNRGPRMGTFLGGIALGALGGRFLPPLLAAMTGSGRARSGADPFARLIDDHRQIQSLLGQMREASPDSKLRRSRLFLMLKRKLAKHALAEEDVVYPIVHSQSQQGDDSKHLYDEHAGMKILLYELEQKVKSGDDWSTEVASLSQLVGRHIEDEETNIFPQLRQRLAEGRLPTVSGQISREEALIV